MRLKMAGEAATQNDLLDDRHELVVEFWKLCLLPRSDEENAHLHRLTTSYDDLARRRRWYLMFDKRLLLRDSRPAWDEVLELHRICAQLNLPSPDTIRLYPDVGGWADRQPRPWIFDPEATVHPSVFDHLGVNECA